MGISVKPNKTDHLRPLVVVVRFASLGETLNWETAPLTISIRRFRLGLSVQDSARTNLRAWPG